MHLYVGNPTRQDHVFAYRLPEQKGIRFLPIRRGGQVKLPGDLTTAEVDSIVAQKRRYGLRKVEEAVRSRGYVSLVFQVDKQITAAHLNAILTANVSRLVERGKEQRKQAAVAVSNQVEEQLRDRGLPMALNEIDMEVVEEGGGDDALAEGTAVTSIADRMPADGKSSGEGKGRSRRAGRG